MRSAGATDWPRPGIRCMECGDMIARLILVVLAALLTACGGGVPQSSSDELAATREAQPFDREDSDNLLAEAQQAAQDDPAAAASLYRAAALRWPDNMDAWQRLAELERSDDNLEGAEAAEFVVDRLRLYPSEELYVQRQVNAALKTYLEEQRSLPGHNPVTQTYGAQLTMFYDALLSEQPAYVPPSGIFNLAPNEIPTAVITAAAGYIYFKTLSGN